ncbi:MAG: SGNH/GDSL hydrolase family protein [Acidimicrobiia bacterium]|nr:SGNH/GDSL hydrolase family protein [Acidimicrobiia bacterium]
MATRTRTAMIVVPAIPAVAAAIVATQVLRAAHRPDLPSYPNQDPSGTFGDPALPRLRIVALGDSSITAPGVADLDNIWIRRVARSLADRFHVELISLAVGGSKASDVLEGQLEGALRLHPDVAVVSVGANDALRGVPPERYRHNLTTIVTRLAATGAGVLVFGMGDLGSIPRLPPSLRRWTSHRSEVFDRIARQVVVTVPSAVKVHTRGRCTTAFFEDPSLFAGDQFHAGDAGHGVFADDALEAMEAAIAVRRTAT